MGTGQSHTLFFIVQVAPIATGQVNSDERLDTFVSNTLLPMPNQPERVPEALAAAPQVELNSLGNESQSLDNISLCLRGEHLCDHGQR